jgi:glucokinase
MFGAGRGVRSLALLALGTGVGGAIIAGGRLLRGEGGAAGEFGHVPVELRGAPCVCGGRGCLSLFIGGEFMARAARSRVEAGEPSALLDRAGGDPGRIDTVLVFQAAAAGDALASELVERACEALGAGIALVVNSLDPGLVIVTGGVAASLVALESDVVRAVRRYALRHVLNRTCIRILASDKDRTVLGGAALALYELRWRAPVVAMPAGQPS